MLPRLSTFAHLRYCAFVLVFASIVSVTTAEDRTAYVLDIRGQWKLDQTSTNLVRAATR